MNLCKSTIRRRRRLCILLQSSHLFSPSSPRAEPEREPEFPRFEIDPKFPPQRYIGHLDWPKPSKIPWRSNKTNSISLIGSVSMPVPFQDESPDGKSTVIAILSHDSSPILRIPIIFKGYLADVAAVHLKGNDIIHVDGHLSGDSLPPELIKEHGHFGIQVTVHCINFIKESFQGRLTYTTYTQVEKASGLSVNTLKDTHWRDLFNNPSQWADYRKDKLNGLVKPKYPDFKRKDSGQPLWIDSAPKWAISELQVTSGKGGASSLSSAQQPVGSSCSNSKRKSEQFKNLIESPDKWTDKRSGKALDLIHKDTHEAAWLDSSPTWVLEKLPPASKPKDESEESWENLIENPDKWVDIRSEKINIKEPDFLHKDTGDALWLSNAPTWALGKLPPSKRL